MSASASRTPRLGRRVARLPWWKQALFSLLLVAAFFGLVEGGLAVLGVRPLLVREDPYVGFASNIPLFVERRDPAGRVFLETAENKLDFFNPQRFARSKPEGAYRIFCVGGSTTYGRPYDDATSFCGWLRAYLRAAAPGTGWEVVNAGGISYASYRVAALMQELAGYDPDLFLIYSGQNEFLERRTYAPLLEKPQWVIRLDSLASRTRTYTILKGLARRLERPGDAQDDGRYRLPGEVSAVLDRSVGPSAYRRDEALTARVLEHYRLNLARMVEIARTAGAEAMLITPASNLKDCSPFKSEHRVGLGPEERAAWEQAYARGRELQRMGRPAEAVVELERAYKLDPRYAALDYALGQALYALGRYEEAGRALARARDEDVCPLRALSPMPGLVRRVAAEHGVPLVDFERIVAKVSRARQGNEIPGAGLFLDHVHPTIEGNRLLAHALFDHLVGQGIARPTSRWDDVAEKGMIATVRGGVDRQRQGVALRNLAKVLSWAGKSADAAALARRSLGLVGADAESWLILGVDATEREDWPAAESYYEQAIALEPGYLKALTNLGVAEVRQAKYDEAVGHYRQALALSPGDADVYYNLARAYSRQGRLAQAEEAYREAARLAPEDPGPLYNLAGVQFQRRAWAEAAASYRRLLALAPHDVDALYFLGRAELKLEDYAAARRALRAVIEVRPRDPKALYLAGTASEGLGRLDEARGHYRAALRERPNWSEPQGRLARLSWPRARPATDQEKAPKE